MRRFVTALLATVLFCTGAAWASDVHLAHPHGDPTHAAALAGGDAMPDAAGHCGHCCHAGGHYLGLVSAALAAPRQPYAGVCTRRVCFLSGRTLEPPIRPPNA